MVCDSCTDHHQPYIASRQVHFKQYGRADYLNNQKLLGMRVRQYKQLDDAKIACPLCQSMVSKVHMSTHKKTGKCKQLRDGNTASNARKTVQTVRIFDGVNAEPRIVTYIPLALMTLVLRTMIWYE